MCLIFQELQSVAEGGPYNLVGYSFGACIAFEMALQLQGAGKAVKLSLLDGSHAYVAAHTEERRGTEAEDETEALCAFILQFCPTMDYKELQQNLLKQETFSGRLKLTDKVLREKTKFPDNCQITAAAKSFYRKLLVAAEYKPEKKLKLSEGSCEVTLIKAENGTHEAAKLGADYGLGKVVEGEMEIVVHSVSGDHTSFIQNEAAKTVADILTGKKMAV